MLSTNSSCFTQAELDKVEDYGLMQDNIAAMGALLNERKYMNARQRRILDFATKQEKERKAQALTEVENLGQTPDRRKPATTQEPEVDHYVKWIKMHSREDGYFHAVQIRLDSGALSKNANFVTRAMVEEYRLKTKETEPRYFEGVSGDCFYCSEKVVINWKDIDGKSQNTECLVLPAKSKIKLPLLGQDFMNKHSAKLFDRDPSDPSGVIQYVAESKKDDFELKEIAAARAAQDAQDQLDAQKRRDMEMQKLEQRNGSREGRSNSLRKSNMSRKRRGAE